MNLNCFDCDFKSITTNNLSKLQIQYLQDNCKTAVFKKGDVIFKEGDLSENIAYIKNGLAKLHMKGLTEQQQIIKLVKSPNFLGIPTSLGDEYYQYSATAIAETSVCFINLETFKNLLLDNKEFSYNIIVDLCKKELNNFKTCLFKVQKQSAGLLADTLLDIANSIYNSLEFELPLTRQELADLIGTSRENVSRTLSYFQKNGIVKVDKHKIKILDEKRLKKISGFG